MQTKTVIVAIGGGLVLGGLIVVGIIFMNGGFNHSETIVPSASTTVPIVISPTLSYNPPQRPAILPEDNASTPTSSPIDRSPIEPAPKEMKVYKNDTYGFALKYPQNFTAIEKKLTPSVHELQLFDGRSTSTDPAMDFTIQAAILPSDEFYVATLKKRGKQFIQKTINNIPVIIQRFSLGGVPTGQINFQKNRFEFVLIGYPDSSAYSVEDAVANMSFYAPTSVPSGSSMQPAPKQ